MCSGVEIVRVKKGKKTVFEVSGDFAGELHRQRRFDGNNGDLEDELSAEAKRAKKRIQWSSEADTLVAQAADLATARWIVEQLVRKGSGTRPGGRPTAFTGTRTATNVEPAWQDHRPSPAVAPREIRRTISCLSWSRRQRAHRGRGRRGECA